MNTEPTPRSQSEVIDEISTWTVGLGIITMALFPLALPAIVLIAILALPLVLLALGAGLLFAIVALPVLLVRALSRRAIRGIGSSGMPTRGHPGSSPQTAAGA